ncbi:MAG: hypothetical protein JJE52_09080 [Acidimicrobiia bacterium]|nr:hypothetical protein [Acidimicrobiia bacterium]
MRLNLRWSPQWLTDAGFTAVDAGGDLVSMDGAAVATGQITWSPDIRTCRVEDQISNNVAPGSTRYERRLAGELALLALWTRAMLDSNLVDIRPNADLDGNTRGARFRDYLVYSLNESLPEGWM